MSHRLLTGRRFNGLSVRPFLLVSLAAAGLLGLSPAAVAALSITSPSNLGTRTTGVIQIPLLATGGTGALTWTVSGTPSLPAGLAIRTDVPSTPGFAGATAGIIGVATSSDGGTPYSFSLQVADSSTPPQTATQAFTLHVTSENFQDLNTLPDAVAGVPYSYTFTLLNGTTPTISLAPSSPTLPTGLGLSGATSSAITLSGMPSAPGNYSFQLQAVDGTTTVTRTFNLFVAAVGITTPGVLPNAMQGSSYTAVPLAATGGSGGYSYVITSGGLPQGLNLTGGSIVGSVASFAGTGRYAVGITVSDSSAPPNSYQQFFTIDVIGTTPQLPSLQVHTLDDATVGNPYTTSFSASGGVAPYTWSITFGSDFFGPTGLSFRSGTGTSSYVNPGDVEIWGVPQTPPGMNNYFTLTATDSTGASVSTTVTLHISALSVSSTGLSATMGTAITTPQLLRVVGGKGGYTGSLAAGSGLLPSGTTLNSSPTGANITGAPAENGTFNFRPSFTDGASPANGITVSSNIQVNPSTLQIFTNYDLGIYPSGSSGTTVNMNFNACCAASYNWSVAAGSTLPSGLMLVASTGQLTGSVAAPGTYTFFVQVADSSSPPNIGVKNFKITFSPASITTASLPYGNVTVPYNGGTGVQLAASGTTGALTWTIISGFLPPAMVFNGGLISGTPGSTGLYNFTVQVVDASGNRATRNLSLSVYPVGGGPPVFISTPAALGTYMKGDLEADLNATGGSGTYVWSVAAGSTLPPGLSLRTDPASAGGSGAQAALIGVATTAGTYPFTLVVTSAGNTASRAFTMKITALNLADTFSLPDGFNGSGYNYTLTPVNAAAGSTMTYALATGSSLPNPLVLNSSTGAITGTLAATAGNYRFTITASDGTDTISRFFNLKVSNIQITSAAILPNVVQGHNYTQSLTATGGSGTVTFTALGLPGNLTVTSGNIITGTVNSNAFPGKYSVSVTATDGTNSTTKQFSIDVIASAAQLTRLTIGIFSDPVVGDSYSTTFGTCCGGVAPLTWSATGLPAGLFIRYAGAGTAGTASGSPSSGVTPGDVEVYGVPQTAGSSVVTLGVTDALGATTSQSFTMHVAAVNETVQLNNGTIGMPYNATLREIGGAPGYTASLVNGALPAGITLGPATVSGVTTAAIAGTPVESGNFNFTLQFTDSAANTYTRQFGINIANATSSNLQINTNSPLQSLVTGTTGINIQLNACCASGYIWSLLAGGGALPSGLSLNASSGAITGTATPTGNYTFLVNVTDSSNAANTAVKQFTLQISPLTITTPTLPFGNLMSLYGGSAAGVTVSATGGTGTLTWSLAPFTLLPPGLMLNSSTGAITGTPTSTGQYAPTIVVQDSAGHTASFGYNQLNIYPAGSGPALGITTGSAMGTYSIGEYQIELDATGGNGSYSWSLAAGSGSLPPGYAIRTDMPSFFSTNASAGLIGVGTVPGTYNFTLQVTSGTQSTTQAFTITITGLTTKDTVLPDAYVNGSYSFKMTPLNVAAGHTAAFSVTSTCSVAFPTSCLPPGLSMASDGTITNTAPSSVTTPGAYTFNVQLTDGTSTVNHQYGINVYAITIPTAAALPNATQGVAYSGVTLTATGGTGALTWTSNNLPSGFTLTSGGVLSAPATFNAGPGQYEFTITVTDSTTPSAISSVKRFSLNITGSPATLPSLNNLNFDDATMGQQYSRTISVNGGGIAPYTYSVTGLPAGLSTRAALATQNGNSTPADLEIWGVPLATGSSTVTITATDVNHVSVSNTFTLLVSALVRDPGLPQGTTGIHYTAPLKIVGGTGPYSVVSQISGALPDGLTRSAQTVSGTPLENGQFTVTYQYADSASNTLRRNEGISIGNGGGTFSINSNANLGSTTVNQSYSTTLNACCIPNPISWALAPGSALPSGMSLGATTGTLSGTPTATGTFTFLVEAFDSTITTNTAYRQFNLVVTPIIFTGSPSLPYGNVGTLYSQTLVTTGATGAVTWTLNYANFLPPGLMISGNTISGTPTSTGQYSFTLTGTDTAGNTISRNFNINVYAAGGAPPLFLLSNNQTYTWPLGLQTIQLSASGGVPPYTYSLTPGATVVPGCRVQNGQPLPTNFTSSVTGGYLCMLNTLGTTVTSIRVTDSASNTFDRPVTVNVLPLMLNMQNPLPIATSGVPYTFNPTANGGVAATGGTGAYTFSATGLPTGLNISSSTGAITGTPSVSGSFTANVTLGNAAVTGTVGFTLNITVNPYAITSAGSLPQGTVGSTYSTTLTAPACGAPCTWSFAGGSLPSPLTLSSGGVISSGTQTFGSPFNATATVQVSGSNGTSQQVVSLIVGPSAITALSITTNIAQTSQLGGSAAFGLFAVGGTPPYTFSLSSGTLPPGVALLSTTGDQLGGGLAAGTQYLAGRPTAAATYSFTLQVTDSTAGTHLTATKAFSWTISPLNISYGSLPIFGTSLTLGSSYTQPLLVIGGTGTYTSWVNQVPLQPGLVLNSTTGVVSGTPTNTGNLSVPILVSDSAATPNVVNSNVNINVASGPSGTVTLGGPNSGTLVPLGSTQNYNVTPSGGTGPYTVTAVGPLPAGVLLESGSSLGSSFGSGQIGLQVILAAPGTYTFTLQAVDSSTPSLTGARTYTLIVPAFGPAVGGTTLTNGSVLVPYSQQLYSYDNTAAVTWTLTPGSALPPGMGISAGGVLGGTPTAAGTYSFSLTYGDSSGSNTITYTLKISALAITTSPVLPIAYENLAYGPGGAGVTLTATGATGGTTTWTLASSSAALPSGLSLSAGGVISGTPSSAAGFYPITVTATNAGASVSKQFSIFLSQTNPGTLDFPIGQTALADAVVDQPYSVALVGAGGAPGYTWSVAAGSTLPPGLSLLSGSALLIGSNPGTTVLAGQPSTAGQYTFNLVLTDSTSASTTRTFSLNVTPLSITSGNPPSAQQGVPYSFQLLATGGTAPYSFSATPSILGRDALPTGLNISSTGLISGTPTGTGTFSFILTVTDSSSPPNAFTVARSLTSNNSLGHAIPRQNINAAVNGNYNIPLTVNGSSATYTWSIQLVSPAPSAPYIQGLPPGIMLSGSSLVGNTTTAGFYQFMLQAVNTGSSSDVVRRMVTWRVTPISFTAPVEYGLFSADPPPAAVGTAYSFTFKAAGGTPPYTFTEDPAWPKPLGLTLSATGVLSGTPTQSGSYSLHVIATDSTGSFNIDTFPTLIVTSPAGHPAMNERNTVNVSDATVGSPYVLTLDRLVEGGVAPYTWSVTGGTVLPPGMSLMAGSNGLTSIIAGTPTAAGTYMFTLSVADASGQTLSIPVQGFNVSVLGISPGSIPSAVVGSSYSVALSFTGGTPPYSFQNPGGFTPPPGMSLSGGALSGSPVYAGDFPIAIQVTDSATPANTVTKYIEFSVDNSAGEVPSVAVAPKPVNILFISGTATTSTPITVSSSSGALPFNAALFGLAGTTLSAASGSTSTSVNLNFGSVAPGTYTGFLGVSAPSSVNAGDFTPVNLTVLAPPPCSYTLSPGTTSSPTGGGPGNFNISTAPSCGWTLAVSGSSPWITIPGSVTAGSGNGTISYVVAANGTGTARTGTITVTGSTSTQTFTVNQFTDASCSISISPSSLSGTPASTSATFNVTTSASTCAWTATGLGAMPSSGTGSGTVTVNIPANVGGTTQVSTATVSLVAPASGSQTFTFTQSAATCTYTLSAPTALFDATGGSGSVNITATNSCPYTTVPGPSWLNITSGGSGTGTGSAQTLTFTVDPNSTTLPRTGAITIGGQTFAVTEAALGCSISADTSTLGSPFPAGGGTGTIGITTNGSNCSWNAASLVGFATVSPATGFGNGSITVTTTSNAASVSSRSGSLTVSGQTITFSQAGTTCSFSLRSTSSSLPSLGGLATASVVAPSACSWTAVSNASWLTVIASGSGGTADVSFTADANPSAIPRTGTLTIAGQTFTVTEGGAPCTFTLGAAGSGALASNAVPGQTAGYTASTSGCSAAVTSYAGWITIVSNAFAGTTGTVTYNVAANASGARRTGNIQIGDQVYTVTQTGNACAYSMASYGITVNYLGALGNILGSANLNSCSNPTVGTTQPFITLGTLTGTPSQYTLPFTISTYPSASKSIRKGLITFGGLTFSVKQTSF